MMSRHRTHGKAGERRYTTIPGQFAAREIVMLESPAYRVLSLAAHRVLARLEIELAHHGGNDNGKLPVTFDHFVEYGIHRHSIAPAISELEALGFIEVTEQGRAGNGAHRKATRFRLTYKPILKSGHHNDPATNDWRRIKSIERAEQIAAKARRTKTFPSDGFRTETSAGKRTTTPQLPVMDSALLCRGKNRTTSIFRGGARAGAAGGPDAGSRLPPLHQPTLVAGMRVADVYGHGEGAVVRAGEQVSDVVWDSGKTQSLIGLVLDEVGMTWTSLHRATSKPRLQPGGTWLPGDLRAVVARIERVQPWAEGSTAPDFMATLLELADRNEPTMLSARQEHWLRILIERTERTEQAEAKRLAAATPPTLVVINGGRDGGREIRQ